MIDYLVLTLDCNDVERQAAFWQDALGYVVVGGVGPYRALGDPVAGKIKFLLQEVPESKSAKNRLHLDLHVADVDAESARLVGLGATATGAVEEFGLRWIVMADPEGNEFCVCAA
jgi:predicted enzyme related to lactoylglutathione lyase